MIKSAKNILLLCLMLVGCAQTEEVNDHLVWRLDPVKVQRMDLKQIVDSICIVPLETNDSCLIKKVHSLEYAHGLMIGGLGIPEGQVCPVEFPQLHLFICKGLGCLYTRYV